MVEEGDKEIGFLLEPVCFPKGDEGNPVESCQDGLDAGDGLWFERHATPRLIMLPLGRGTKRVLQ
jgi:hypothetical protein